MSPLVVYVKECDDDNVVLKKQEFEDMLEKAYSDGYENGRLAGKMENTPLTVNPLPYNPYGSGGTGVYKNGKDYITANCTEASSENVNKCKDNFE